MKVCSLKQKLFGTLFLFAVLAVAAVWLGSTAGGGASFTVVSRSTNRVVLALTNQGPAISYTSFSPGSPLCSVVHRTAFSRQTNSFLMCGMGLRPHTLLPGQGTQFAVTLAGPIEPEGLIVHYLPVRLWDRVSAKLPQFIQSLFENDHEPQAAYVALR